MRTGRRLKEKHTIDKVGENTWTPFASNNVGDSNSDGNTGLMLSFPHCISITNLISFMFTTLIIPHIV